MPKTTVRIGPADHGQRMTLDEFELAEVVEGYHYELGKGAIVVTDLPKPKHLRILTAIRRQFAAYDLAHPGSIDTIAGGGECKILLEDQQSERHPDLAVYLTPAPVEGNAVWGLWIPEVVVEVVSPGSEERDYREKREEYLAFGVKEYWIVDPGKRSMLVLRRERGRWTEQRFGPSETCETPLLPGLRFACGPVFEAAGE
ncbi:Uma2 family endonuclease [Tautonia rosea]|uniref:Uma2 family endonuclease n=1 Tax=Tautonia rosea TaxID=2728037 RepID=UPI0019CF99DF|nr:Uma2 family endonuclease [Tautonia rosea]